MKPERFIRKSFPVDAVRVTKDEIGDIARWSNGVVKFTDAGHERGEGVPFIKIVVDHAINEKQTEAFLGDWVLKMNGRFKVYTHKAFQHVFERPPVLSTW